MRISILTTGRFHLCDLARELSALGHDVAFISCVPKHRTRRYGLPDSVNKCILLWVAPVALLLRLFRGTRFQRNAENLLAIGAGIVGAYALGECDVFIGLSGMSRRAALKARRKFGARVWIERGSRHILSQAEILEAIAIRSPDVARVPASAIVRELADYSVADRIVVPSRHVEESFLERGSSPALLFRNPYGVDLAMFPPTPQPAGPVTLLMTGSWSYRKGADLLTAACVQIPGVHLLHVGPVGDCPLPSFPGFTHVDSVPQEQLISYYEKAHIFVLPSREEGMAVVQMQALACGLRLVCSDRSGGEDLGEISSLRDFVTVVPSDDVPALVAAIRSATELAEKDFGMRDRLGADRAQLSWQAYGKRYDAELRRDRSEAAKVPLGNALPS